MDNQIIAYGISPAGIAPGGSPLREGNTYRVDAPEDLGAARLYLMPIAALPAVSARSGISCWAVSLDGLAKVREMIEAIRNGKK